MTERPILFSGPMVRAILAGRKTQTRRVAKVKPGILIQEIEEWQPLPDGLFRRAVFTRDQIAEPRFASGDNLWVREAWGWYGSKPSVEEHRNGVPVFYRADDGSEKCYGVDWRPSIHMPRWASRLTLTVTDVRVQRLQDIDQHDAEAEGVDCSGPVAVNCFHVLWNSLNEDRGYGWEANPWVVAVTFTAEKRNIDALRSLEGEQ